jgi:hypothetical protein
MCSSKNGSDIDERTTTEISIVYYDSSLEWELTRGCRATTSDPVVRFIHRNMEFPSIFYIKGKHNSI